MRLRAVLAILRIFAHFWPRFLRCFSLHFQVIFHAIFGAILTVNFRRIFEPVEESTLPPKNRTAKQRIYGVKKIA